MMQPKLKRATEIRLLGAFQISVTLVNVNSLNSFCCADPV